MDRDYKLVSEAPAGSQLFRLFHSRLKRGNGFFLIRRASATEDFYKMLEMDPTSYYCFMNRLSFLYTAFMSSSFFERMFFKPANYYETLSVTYLRKNLEKSVKSDLIKK